MTQKIKTYMHQTEEIHDSLVELLANEELGNNERQTLLIAYFDICMEHIQSIHILIRHENYGSAFTLLRPTYETLFRALWMLAIAENSDLEKIRNDEFRFPLVKDIVKDLDGFYTKTEFFQNIKNDGWKAMCDYAHTGTLQLSRRWRDDELKPNYSDEEVFDVLKNIRMAFLLFAYVVLKEHGYDDANKLILRYY